MLKSPKFWAATCAVLLYLLLGRPSTVSHPPGILAPTLPVQHDISDPERWKKGEYLITPLADYSMTGVVVRSKRYYLGKEADLSPLDFVMAWGPASDTAVLDKIKWSQSMRYYSWRTKDDEIDLDAVNRNTANVHILPATDAIAKKLKGVKWRQVVDLGGYLIQAETSAGWSWRSSLTRDDTGAGACEVFWVDRVTLR